MFRNVTSELFPRCSDEIPVSVPEAPRIPQGCDKQAFSALPNRPSTSNCKYLHGRANPPAGKSPKKMNNSTDTFLINLHVFRLL